jgi:hypothetical protein
MAEPELIDGAWWAQSPDGSWLRFNQDSQQWEPSVAPARPPVPPPPPHSPPSIASPATTPTGFGNAPIIVWFVLGAAVLVCMGSLGPWATISFLTVNGTDGDGVITLILGLIAGTMALLQAAGRGIWAPIVAAVCFSLSALTGIIDWADLERTFEGSFFGNTVSVGWGLVVMTFAAAAGAILSFVSLFVRRRPAAVPATA